MPTRLTKSLAERHESLVLRLEALQKSILPVAAKHPEAPLSDTVRVLVEALLFDALPFLPKSRDRFPSAAPDQAGLAAQLGQALAALLAYETHWTEWDARKSCFCWMLEDERLPVRRLRPQIALAPKSEPTRDILDIRAKLAQRMHNAQQNQYRSGYRAGIEAATAAAAAGLPKPDWLNPPGLSR